MTNKKKEVKRISTDIYNYKGSKGITIEGESQTVQDDSMSLREMIANHVQGTLDNGLEKDGMYHGEDVDFDTDVSHLQNYSELEALEYAEEHGKTDEELHAELDVLESINSETGSPEITEESLENDNLKNTSEEL